jgi:hypothetical protein
VRGFVSILGSKGGQKIESSKNAAGERSYHIANTGTFASRRRFRSGAGAAFLLSGAVRRTFRPNASQ